jgi:DNA-binding phage protein
MTSPKKTPDENFLAAIKASSVGAQINKEQLQAIAQQRKVAANELAAVNAANLKEWPEAVAAQEKAIAKAREIEKQLAKAWEEVNRWTNERSRISNDYSMRRTQLEYELKESSSPLIDECIKVLWAEIDATWKLKEIVFETVTNALTRKKEVVEKSNYASCKARVAAIRAAIPEVEEMKLIADQSSVPAALEAIKAGLPTVEKLEAAR